MFELRTTDRLGNVKRETFSAFTLAIQAILLRAIREEITVEIYKRDVLVAAIDFISGLPRR